MKDVLIVYELRNREIENAGLLAAELERRGMTVSLKNVASLSRYFTRAKMVVAPHLYDDNQVAAVAKNVFLSHKKILDLQYEQVLSENDHEGIHNPQGEAKEAQHIAWGNAQRDAYLKHDIKPENIHVTGSIGLDILSEEFDGYFLKRNIIAKEFNLDATKQWVLFISSFSYCNRTEKELDAYEKMFPGSREFADFSNASQKEILDWLKKMASKHRDKIFIYRPHPAEKHNPLLVQIERELPNFRCINNYSVRQWIKICDKLYTWYSTSIADAYFANKICKILRPLIIPDGFEVDIMVGANMITTIDGFENNLDSEDGVFPIPKEVMSYYYGEKDIKPSFIKVADLCQEIIASDKYCYAYNYGARLNILNSDSLKNAINIWGMRLLVELTTHFKITPFLSKIGVKSQLLEKLERQYYGVYSEFEDYKRRFSPIVSLYSQKLNG